MRRIRSFRRATLTTMRKLDIVSPSRHCRRLLERFNMVLYTNSPPKLGGVPSEARRGGSHKNLPVFAHFVREATPPNFGGEFSRCVAILMTAVVLFACTAKKAADEPKGEH